MALDTQFTIEEIEEKKQELISKLEKLISLITGKKLEEFPKLTEDEFVNLKKIEDYLINVRRSHMHYHAYASRFFSKKILHDKKEGGYKDSDQAIKMLLHFLSILKVWIDKFEIRVKHKKENDEIKNLLDELNIDIYGHIKQSKIAEAELVQAGFHVKEAQKIVSILVKKKILDQ